MNSGLIFMFIFIQLAFGAGIPNSQNECKINNRPIIGIMNHHFGNTGNQFIATSYVKWLEMAGARVVPIFNDEPDDYYEKLLRRINGALLPGGDSPLDHGPYAETAERVLDIARKLNSEGIYFPVWATCLGFEKMVSYFIDNYDWLVECNAYNIGLNMELTSNATKSRVFRNMKPSETDLLKTMQEQPTTAHYHVWCLTTQTFEQSDKLNKHFDVIATNHHNGHEFVSLMEHRQYPFYTSIFHPEMIQFEWVLGDDVGNHPHDYNSVRVSQYLGNFFVNETRKNCASFSNRDVENEHLVYNYDDYLVYRGKEPDAFYEEIFEFPNI